MKTVAVFFSGNDPMGYPLNEIEWYTSYKNLTNLCQENNIQFLVARGQDSYMGNMQFSHLWKIENDAVTKVEGPITVSLIYEKSHTERLVYSEGDVVLNDPKFDDICRDKMATYTLFPEWMKQCVLVSEDNWETQIAKLNTDTIVLKPLYGESGEGILFVEKNNFTFKMLDASETYLAQEFLESATGIPGIMTGRHDMRIVMNNSGPVVSFVRAAKEGSFLSNISQGATSWQIDIEKIPQQALDVAKKIDQKLSNFNYRFYSIDLMFEGENPYLTELNSRPGLMSPKHIGEKDHYQLLNSLLDLFKKL